MNALLRPSSAGFGMALFCGSCAVFVGMWLTGFRGTALALPAIVGWFAALIASRPLVPEEKRQALHFSFVLAAFFIFFLHETYEYRGSVRTFPLMVGWIGSVLTGIEILAITETRVGRVLGAIFGARPAEIAAGERPVKREVACIAAITAAGPMVWILGFLGAAPVFVFLWMWLWGGKPVRFALYAAIAVTLFIWLLFEFALSYELYRGLAFEWTVELMGE
jgi:hypothetical protein